jgi:hypothetical protein
MTRFLQSTTVWWAARAELHGSAALRPVLTIVEANEATVRSHVITITDSAMCESYVQECAINNGALAYAGSPDME